MSCQEKYRAIRSVTLSKEKRCDKIKGRTCADGSCQRTYIPREESTPPTIVLEALFLSLLIDTHEGIAVQTVDVPGAYLHTSLTDDKVVHMKFEGEFGEMMCKVNPEYEKFVIYDKVKKLLYVLILKAIYGMIESALLWYNLFSATLLYLRFKLNPY